MKFILFILIVMSAYADETQLIKDCQSKNLIACEHLADVYLQKSDWENAYLISDALCKTDNPRSCMIAGTALLAQKKIREATPLLTKACDDFEPLACRSMGRLMSKAGDKVIAHSYFVRGCQYGLRELCKDLKPEKSPLSDAAQVLVKQIEADCSDTKSKACSDDLKTVQSCALPLNRQDCQLLAGHLSVYFRAKIFQEEAKVILLSLQAQQKMFKDAENSKGYSYDLKKVQQDAKVMEKYHYVFGFMRNCGKKYLRMRKPPTVSQELYPKAYKHMSARMIANINAYFNKGKAEDCYDPKSGYEAYAVSNIDLVDPSRLDVWMIDQDGRMKHVQDGLPRP